MNLQLAWIIETFMLWHCNLWNKPNSIKIPLTTLKGLPHEVDLKNVDENEQILALLRAAAGF